MLPGLPATGRAFRSFRRSSPGQRFFQNPKLRVLDRAFISELVLGTLRWRSRLDLAIHRAVKFPEKKIDPKLLHLLRLGAYQILFMTAFPLSRRLTNRPFGQGGLQRRKDFRVHQRRSPVGRPNKSQEGFPPFEKQPVEYITQVLSHPRWMWSGGCVSLGPIWPEDVRGEQPPPALHGASEYSEDNPENSSGTAGRGRRPSLPAPYSPEGLILQEGLSLSEEPFFQKGFYSVQDEASQIVAHLLNPQPGERVLDACAAPGGKTTHLASL